MSIPSCSIDWWRSRYYVNSAIRSSGDIALSAASGSLAVGMTCAAGGGAAGAAGGCGIGSARGKACIMS